MKASELIKLIKDVLDNDLGRQLLGELENQTVGSELFTSDTNLMYKRIGQVDLMIRLKNLVNLSNDKLNKIIAEELKDELNEEGNE